MENNFRQKEDKKFLQKTGDIFMNISGKIGSNKILGAVRDAFMVTTIPSLGLMMPIVIGILFFNNSTCIGQIPGIHDSAGMLWIDKHIFTWFLSIQQISGSGFSLILVLGMGWFMMKQYSKSSSPITGIIVTLGCFMLLNPFGYTWNGGVAVPWDDSTAKIHSTPFSVVGLQYIGSNGLVLALAVGIIAPLIFCKLQQIEKIKIKIGGNIPQAISDVLSNMIIITIMFLGFSLVSQGWAWISYAANITSTVSNSSWDAATNQVVTTTTEYYKDTLFIIVNDILSRPFQNAAESIWVTAAVIFFICIFWTLGMHGFAIMGPVLIVLLTAPSYNNYYFWAIYISSAVQPMVGNTGQSFSDSYYNVIPALHKTAEALAAQYGQPIEVIRQMILQQSNGIIDIDKGLFIAPLGTYSHGLMKIQNIGVISIGGSGITFSFTYGLLLFSNYKPYKEVAKVEAVPAIFGINEPLMFGLPLAFNLGFFIPFTIMSTIVGTFAHLCVVEEWVRPGVVAGINGFTPVILRDFLGTGMDWRQIILEVGIIIVSFAYWTPFIKIGENFTMKQFAQSEGLTIKEYRESHPELFEKSLIKKMISKLKRA